MAWSTIATLTPSKQWAFTPISSANFFRIKHIDSPFAPILWICQAAIDDSGLQLFDVKKLSEDYLNQVIRLESPPIFADRVIGIKSNIDTSRWQVQIEASDVIPTSSDGNSQNQNISQQLTDLSNAQSVIQDNITTLTQVYTNQVNVVAAIQATLNNLSSNQATQFSVVDQKLEQIYQKLSTPVSNTPATKTLAYASGGDTNGLFYWLGTKGGTQPYSNPGQNGIVAYSQSSTFNNSTLAANNLNNRGATDNSFHTLNNYNEWVEVDLKQKFNLRGYSIQGRTDYNGNHPKSWNILGSNNGIDRDIIDQVAGFSVAFNTWVYRAIDNSNYYRYYRLQATGADSSNGGYLAFGEWEFYGVLEL